MVRVALVEPDIPQNTAAVMRLCACFGVGLDIVEPCGFVFDDRRLRRVGMDYVGLIKSARHPSWDAFLAQRGARRLILVTTRGDSCFPAVAFRPDDLLLFGRESAGAGPAVHAAADLRLCIPMRPPARSLNVAMAAAMVLAEALRQTGGYPPFPGRPEDSA